MKIQVVTFPRTEQVVDIIDQNGRPAQITVVTPPASSAIRKSGTNVWITFSDDLESDASKLTGAAMLASLPVRSDLPEDHPLFGLRALKCVPAGFPDIVYDQIEKTFSFHVDGELIDVKHKDIDSLSLEG